MIQLDRPQMIWHMRIARWIPKATNTHSEYVTLIALPMQQWLHEHTSILFYTYITCLVIPDFLHLLVCSTRSILFYILCYALEICQIGRDTRVPLLFEATTHGRIGGSCGVAGVMQREKTHKYA